MEKSIVGKGMDNGEFVATQSLGLEHARAQQRLKIREIQAQAFEIGLQIEEWEKRRAELMAVIRSEVAVLNRLDTLGLSPDTNGMVQP